MEKRLTGRIDRGAIRMMATPRLAPGILEGFQALPHSTGVVSDVMDELGIACGAVGASDLRPTMPGASIAGYALTVRNVMQRADPLEGARHKVNRMAEFEAHNLAEPGDVLVIQGVAGVSNMGGISSQTGKRQGEVGAVVWGGVRDIDHSRAENYPVWATEITPVTGKWRLQTVEINGPVQIGGVRVEPGDIVIADDTGVCFVPHDRAEEVLVLSRLKAEAEAVRIAAIAAGVPAPDIARATYGEGEGATRG